MPDEAIKPPVAAAPTAVTWPARAVSLHFSHPTCGDGNFWSKIQVAFLELMAADTRGNLDRFEASNGVTVVVAAAEVLCEVPPR